MRIYTHLSNLKYKNSVKIHLKLIEEYNHNRLIYLLF